MKYNLISDGWIKVPAADFQLDNDSAPIGRLLIGLNQVLLNISGKNVLLDVGLGDKWAVADITLLDFEQPRRLLTELSKLGISEDDVDIVVLSHLHYDHSGGGTRWSNDHKLEPTFRNADYFVQKTELEFASNPTPDHVTDYRREDWEPLLDSGKLQVIDGETEIVPGLTVYLAPGHCPGHQVVLAEENSQTLFYPGDLFSTPEHANLKVTTSFDINRDEILEHRRFWLGKAAQNQWNCVFCHNVRNPVGTITTDFNLL